jgi:molybdate/tungstate transport system substrate-binding protein
LLDRAGQIYKLPGLAQKVLGAPDNPEQVRPEENLVGRLQSGQIDVGFFYSTEMADLRIPAITLPALRIGARLISLGWQASALCPSQAQLLQRL